MVLTLEVYKVSSSPLLWFLAYDYSHLDRYTNSKNRRTRAHLSPLSTFVLGHKNRKKIFSGNTSHKEFCITIPSPNSVRQTRFCARDCASTRPPLHQSTQPRRRLLQPWGCYQGLKRLDGLSSPYHIKRNFFARLQHGTTDQRHH